MRHAQGGAGTGIGDECIQPDAAGAEAIAASRGFGGVKAVGAVAEAVTVLCHGGYNTVTGAIGVTITILRDGGVNAIAGIATTITIQRSCGKNAIATAGTDAATIGNLISINRGARAISRHTTFDRGSINPGSTYGSHRAGFNHR